MMGGQNCHTEVVFEDQVRWVARFRLIKTSSPPPEVRDYLLNSEVATMDYLRRHTSIPSPEIYGWACESDQRNSVGVGYIFMEKMKGKPLNWEGSTMAQRERIMQHLVDISLEIEKHPFEAMGSLMPNPASQNGFEIGGLAREATFSLGCKGPLGPFQTSVEGVRAIFESYLSKIAKGEIGGVDPIDVYLTHRFRLEYYHSIWRSPSMNEKFFLMHPDDKGDHILIDDSYQIIGILDWEWAQTVPKELAFSSPCMMWPVGDFYDGLNTLSDDEVRFAGIFAERGRGDLANYVRAGRKSQRLFSLLGVKRLMKTGKPFWIFSQA